MRDSLWKRHKNQAARLAAVCLSALAALASCSPKVVVQRQVVTVHDTVVVQVPVETPRETYSRDWLGRTRKSLDSLCALPLLQESQLGMLVLDLTAGESVYEHGARQRMRPASTMKVVTAVTAMTAVMEHPDCFKLRCWAEENGAAPPGLVLVGGMDPMLEYKDLCALADNLLASGIREVRDVRLDVSLCDTTRWGEGWCWDDGNEAMTPFLYKGAGAARGGGGTSRQAWKQSPEKPFVTDLTKAFAAKKLKIRGRVFVDRTHTAPRVLTSGTGYVRVGETIGGMRLVARVGHDWDTVLKPMMKNSDNLCAEAMLWQLGLLCGEKCPKIGRVDDALETLCKQYGLNALNYYVADGSGRSLYNYVTPELLCVLLNHAALQPWFGRFLDALPVMGVDGTLRKRCIGTTAHARVQAKTGSVQGVSSLAGYTYNSENHLICFAIINQGVRNGGLGRAFQDEVCKVLTRK
ncbi:MAG: D-alanyl-D-alanine carboxypeptidase [Bacteroidaceae bacterium]|nr:D-alanyl-D-alanine carboxypeptidase [Bacteroidaceae bacterium]